MFIQLNDLLLFSKALNEDNSGIELPEVHTKETMNNDIFKMTKVRTKKARSKFIFKTCRIANRLENLINLREPSGLKNRILRTMWNFSRRNFLSEIFALGNCSAIVKSLETIGHYFSLMVGTLDPSAQL